ncbi:acyl carrier protein [Micromonospora sp. KC723]|uniref:acyl carrier protein n=1 Tax=Micromonospora sp. KC723 TaxID=2530381 RepID=UPI00104761BC|nr:acyl carrier protein [Micromonospora sp. KC723]TDB78101.1 acyl carrier protein [Micromonospora sp. KC723]
MERNEIVKNIQGALAEVLMRDFGPLPENTRLFEDLHLDSTAILELLMALEDNIGIEVDPEKLDMGDFRTIGTLTDFLERTPKVNS